MSPTTDLYFESHITVEPLHDDRLATFRELSDAFGFRVADLFLQKRASDTPARSMFDAFATARHTNYDELLARTESLRQACEAAGIAVWRYKIENTLIDVRLKPKAA